MQEGDGREGVCRKGVSTAALLKGFDAVLRGHKAMSAGDFNDDHTYKERLNQVRWTRCHIGTRITK